MTVPSARVPPPVPRLDAKMRTDQLRAATAEDWRLLGSLGGGEVGAALVRRPDGVEAVLTTAAGTAASLADTDAMLRIAADAGLPVPRYLRIVPVADGVLVVQRRLPGSAPVIVDAELVAQLVAVVGRFTGLLASRPDLPTTPLHLVRSGPGFCLHEALAGYDDRTRDLLRRVRAIGAALGDVADGSDLVHLDLHPGNVLVDEAGRLTGIVDWDGIGRGDARFGLVTLWFALSVDLTHRQDGTLALVEAAMASIDPDRRRMFWAHMALRQVDWSIRHHGPDEVDHYLSVGLDGLS